MIAGGKVLETADKGFGVVLLRGQQGIAFTFQAKAVVVVEVEVEDVILVIRQLSDVLKQIVLGDVFPGHIQQVSPEGRLRVVPDNSPGEPVPQRLLPEHLQKGAGAVEDSCRSCPPDSDGVGDLHPVALPAQVRVGTLEGQEQVPGLGSGPFQHGVGKAGGACQLLSQQGGGILEGGRIIDDAPGGVPEKVAGAAGPLLDVGDHVGGGVDRRFAVGGQHRENCGKEKEDAENFRQKKGELFHKMPSFPDDHRPYT